MWLLQYATASTDEKWVAELMFQKVSSEYRKRDYADVYVFFPFFYRRKATKQRSKKTTNQ